MKPSNFIFYTGLWIYFPLVIAICYILDTSVAITEVPGWAYALVIIVPAILPVEITLMNRKRQEYGHRDFGLRDALGIRNESEMETKEWREAAYPEIPDKYLSDVLDGLVIGKYKKKTVRIPVSRDGLNCFVVGGVGSFKSVNLISQIFLTLFKDRINNSNSISLPYNFFCVDIKGEIFETVLKIDEKYKATDGHRLHVIQPSNRDSYGFDVFYRLRKPYVSETEKLKMVTDIADALVEESGDNPYFSDNAKKILTGVLLHYINASWEFIPIIQKLQRTNLNELLTEIVNEAENLGEGIVLDKLKGFQGKEGNESLQDIESTLKTYLDCFSYPDIVWCLHTNEHKTSPAVLNDGYTCLDLAVEQGMLRTYRQFCRLISLLVLRHCESEFHESDHRNTILYWDEFAKIGKVPDVSGCLATLRSKHTGIWMYCQSIQQFKVLYGDDAYTILALCELKMFMSGDGDKETMEYISGMAGEYRVVKRNYDKKGIAGSAADMKYADDFRKIITSESVMNLREKDEEIVFLFGKYMRCRKFKYFIDPYLAPIYKEIAQYNEEHKPKEEVKKIAISSSEECIEKGEDAYGES